MVLRGRAVMHAAASILGGRGAREATRTGRRLVAGWVVGLPVPFLVMLAALATGAWSARVGRKPLIVAGMWLQALAIGLLVASADPGAWTLAMVLLGLGTALVYPTLLAAVSDVAHPSWSCYSGRYETLPAAAAARPTAATGSPRSLTS